MVNELGGEETAMVNPKKPYLCMPEPRIPLRSTYTQDKVPLTIFPPNLFSLVQCQLWRLNDLSYEEIYLLVGEQAMR